MDWNFDDNRAIYSQIIEQMQLFIVSGKLKAGDKLPTVRELAAAASVNPNTMQRALSELERTGLVYTNRTNGRYVTEDAAKISESRKTIGDDIVKSFLSQMQRIGCNSDDALTLLSEYIGRERLK